LPTTTAMTIPRTIPLSGFRCSKTLPRPAGIAPGANRHRAQPHDVNDPRTRGQPSERPATRERSEPRSIRHLPFFSRYAKFPLRLTKRVFQCRVPRIRSVSLLRFIHEVKALAIGCRTNFKSSEGWNSCMPVASLSRCFPRPGRRGWGPDSARQRKRNSGIDQAHPTHLGQRG
jgi:hypothetical protein